MKELRKIGHVLKNQRGFTVVELLIGIAIVGIIGGAIAATVTQTFSGSSTSSKQMTAINNVRNAGDWITRDSQQARVQNSQIVPAGTLSGVFVALDDFPGDFIRFMWYEYLPNSYPNTEWHRVDYYLPAGKNDLTRVEDVLTYSGGVWTTVSSGQPIIVAQSITNITRSIDTTNDVNIFTIIVTADVDADPSLGEETRTFEIRMRPKR